MKKIISVFLALTFAATAALTLVSCGNGSDTTTASTGSTTPVENYSLKEGTFETEPVTSSEGNAVVLTKYTGMDSDIIIPDSYSQNGVTYTVRNIGLGIGFSVPENKLGIRSIKILGGKTKVISDCAFQICSQLKTVEIGEGVETIGAYAFFDCGSLTSVTIPDTVTSIGAMAFAKSAITEIVIPDSVTEIGAEAFANCKALTKVTLPEKFHNNDTLFDIFLSSYKNIQFIFN